MLLEKIRDEDNIIFANGGDRNFESTPESRNFDKNEKIKFIYGVGGNDKKNSSSKILEDWKNTKTQRSWGWYRAFDEKKGIKYKIDGYLEEFALTKNEADDLIINARKIVFK